MVGGAAGCRLFDRDSAWSGRDQFHRGPLSPDHAIGERGIVAQLCLQNPPRIDRLIDVGALRTNRAYYWLSLSLVSFVTAGLREELWRAATLAGMRALWPGAFMSRTGESIAIVSIGVAFGGAHLPMGRFIRRNHFCAAATHRKQVPAAASLGGLRWRFLQP